MSLGWSACLNGMQIDFNQFVNELKQVSDYLEQLKTTRLAMNIEQIKPTVLRITLHTYEIAALVSAARWVTDGAKDKMPKEAIEQIREVLDSYDLGKQKLSV